METFSLFGLLMALLPLILAILVLKWIFSIKKNTDEQVKQNREIIDLLKRNKEDS